MWIVLWRQQSPQTDTLCSVTFISRLGNYKFSIFQNIAAIEQRKRFHFHSPKLGISGKFLVYLNQMPFPKKPQIPKPSTVYLTMKQSKPMRIGGSTTTDHHHGMVYLTMRTSLRWFQLQLLLFCPIPNINGIIKTIPSQRRVGCLFEYDIPKSTLTQYTIARPTSQCHWNLMQWKKYEEKKNPYFFLFFLIWVYLWDDWIDLA